MNKYILILPLIFHSALVGASSNSELQTVLIDLNNKASLQRGAKIFMNNCFAPSNNNK